MRRPLNLTLQEIDATKNEFKNEFYTTAQPRPLAAVVLNLSTLTLTFDVNFVGKLQALANLSKFIAESCGGIAGRDTVYGPKQMRHSAKIAQRALGRRS